MLIHPNSNVHLDWFSMTVDVEHLPTIRDGLTRTFGEFGDEESLNVNKRYNRGVRLLAGNGGIFWRVDEDTGAMALPEAFIDLKGQALARATADQQFDFFEQLELLSDPLGPYYKCTRVDSAFDDWGWLRSPQAIWDRYAKDRHFGGFKSRRQYSGGSEALGDGFTIEFGERGKWGSGKQFVIYDKKAESGGLIDAVRYEVRFFSRDDRASEAWLFAIRGATCCEEWTNRLGMLVGGAIDFYEPDGREGEKNAGRRTAAPWWGTIRGWLQRGEDQGGPRAPRRSPPGARRV
jgi:hypothetical protein